VRELRGLIAEHPGEAVLYLLLGRAYEATTRDEAPQLALACYREVSERGAWGDVRAAAAEAAERLGDTS
jgi:hypothetical protein